MRSNLLWNFIILINLITSCCFTNIYTSFNKKLYTLKGTDKNTVYKYNKDYRKYLINLRKTQKLLLNYANINKISSKLDTNNSNSTNTTYIDNTNVIVKNIMIGNIVLDVSNIKYIQISSKNDNIIIELDKLNITEPIPSTFIDNINNINNIEAIINTITLLYKILNFQN